MAEFSFDAGSEDNGAGGEAGSGPVIQPGNGGAGNPAGGNGAGIGGASGNAPGPDAIPKKRRGRPPGSTNRPKPDAGTATDTGNKAGVDLGFKKNDRVKVLANIAGFHMMAAMLTKQPVMMLSEAEAKSLTNAICDVADYHKINLDGAGGPLGLYAALATCAYSIYVPRIVQIKIAKAGVTVDGNATVPPTPGEVKQRAQAGARPMDFSGDIASTVN